MSKQKIPPISEKEWQRQVVQLARVCGWKVHHARPAMMAKGWRTPIMGDKGYFDLTLCHPERHLFMVVELKTDAGKLTDEQVQWHVALVKAGVDARIWRPRDWAEIKAFLSDGRAM